jgi:predicted Zn-dependent peptidase
MTTFPMAPADEGSWGYTRTKTTLANGLKVVRILQPHLHRGSIAVYFRAGSRYESAAENGLGHFLEHMIFRGSESHPSAFALNLAVEELGGTLFAATAPDCTVFEITLPRESLEQGARLLAEIVTRPLFADIDIERRIVVEEIREDIDEQGAPIDIDFLSRSRLWPSHPLGQAVTGPPRNVSGFRIEDVRRTFERSYVGRNAVVAASGSFDPHGLGLAIEEAFSAMAEGAPIPPSPRPVLARGPSVLHAHRGGSQTMARIAFHAPGEDDPDRTALAILMSVLDDGMSTRLHRRIFEEQGLAYNVSAELDQYEDAGVLDIEAACVHENVPSLVAEALAIVADLRDRPVSDRELGKAKRRATWGLRLALDDPHGMSSWFGEQELFREPEPLEQRACAVEAVTAADVLRVAARVFQPGGLHVTTVGVQDGRCRSELERIASSFA